MSENSSQKLLQYLEHKKEAGLVPEYYWKSDKSQRTGGARQGAPRSIAGPAKQGRETPGDADATGPVQRENNRLSKSSSLEEIRHEIGDCTRCRLSQGRKNIVFGVGNPKAELLFVGEAPGRDEDIKGEPFVGRAGQLLTKIIEAMGFQRSDVYIANVVKCRPPENRNPAPDEIATCSPFLFKQIELIQPKVIVGLGTFAVQTLLATENKITSLRGKLHQWPNAVVQKMLNIQLPLESIKFMPTYHPAFLLRNPNMKKPVWEDMQIVMKELKR